MIVPSASRCTASSFLYGCLAAQPVLQKVFLGCMLAVGEDFEYFLFFAFDSVCTGSPSAIGTLTEDTVSAAIPGKSCSGQGTSETGCSLLVGVGGVEASEFESLSGFDISTPDS